jgi:hypothetical protein
MDRIESPGTTTVAFTGLYASRDIDIRVALYKPMPKEKVNSST